MSNRETTVLYHERIEPLLDVYEDDLEAFGRVMYALLRYSIYGEIKELSDKRENCDLRLLRSMIDLSAEAKARYKTKQTINSNLYYATNEHDMRARLEAAGLSEDEVKEGVDKYRARQSKAEQGSEQFKDWEQYEAVYGNNREK